MRIVAAVGARPNLPKVAAIVTAANALASVDLQVVHTRQHHDHAMFAQLVTDLRMPPPQHELAPPAALVPEQFIAATRGLFADCLHRLVPNAVIVVGDVSSTLACALGAADRGVPIAHVEAGLRSFDDSMPEEHNRIAVDHLSRWLFTTESSAMRNLQVEGIPADRIHFVGNTMVDSLFAHLAEARRRSVCRRYGLAGRDYALVTVHRPATVDDPARLLGMVQMLQSLRQRLPVVFPLHPRTRARLSALGSIDSGATLDGLHFVDPLGYLDFVSLMVDASVVLTDSGGVQEETTALGVPCLTLRANTERPSTIELGTNRLVGGFDAAAVLAAVDATLRATPVLAAVDATLRATPVPRKLPPLWDGAAAPRILKTLVEEA